MNVLNGLFRMIAFGSLLIVVSCSNLGYEQSTWGVIVSQAEIETSIK